MLLGLPQSSTSTGRSAPVRPASVTGGLVALVSVVAMCSLGSPQRSSNVVTAVSPVPGFIVMPPCGARST
ncbi:MAG: hypothetical protein IPN77_18005 [Sandaracinaceae bacterium]|nr:hypothetical protein [Sandaracinaceae bacterium]